MTPYLIPSFSLQTLANSPQSHTLTPTPSHPHTTHNHTHRISFAYARSSGPGGQNVNKLNTKAEARFHVESADWLEPDVRRRLADYQSNKVSKDGELIVSSQEFRTQSRNREDCIDKLREMVAEAQVEPKERQMWVGMSNAGKVKRKDEKRKRGAVKSTRNQKDFGDLMD
ncbi:hypothetical protein B484DRAFT_324801 [Ochromonadaceae sp. CCMP2298]|nr:hypothetical protein B484DRAFT_324801 [Ochromonadaceae sp. CCMP2298]